MPNHDGVIAPSKLVREAILANLLNKQIRPVQCLLVIAGMYATHRCWMMDKEIPFAQTYGKLFIGLPPWGRDRIPESVQAAAHEDGGGAPTSLWPRFDVEFFQDHQSAFTPICLPLLRCKLTTA